MVTKTDKNILKFLGGSLFPSFNQRDEKSSVEKSNAGEVVDFVVIQMNNYILV